MTTQNYPTENQLSGAIAATTWNGQAFSTYIASLLPLEASLLSIVSERQTSATTTVVIAVDTVEHEFQDFNKVDEEIKAASEQLLALSLTTKQAQPVKVFNQFVYDTTAQTLSLTVTPDARPALNWVAAAFPDFATANWRGLESRHTQLTYLFLQSQAKVHGQLKLSRDQLATQLGISLVLPDTMITKIVVNKIQTEFKSQHWFKNFDLTTNVNHTYQLTW